MLVTKFSDFVEEDIETLIGTRTKIDDILEKDIIIKSFTVSKSRQIFNEMFTIYFKLENKMYFIRTSSSILKTQIEKYSQKLPFSTRIVKVGRNYVFT